VFFLTRFLYRQGFLLGDIDGFFRRLLFDRRWDRPRDLVTSIQGNHIGR
jgi:hypothetical protein